MVITYEFLKSKVNIDTILNYEKLINEDFDFRAPNFNQRFFETLSNDYMNFITGNQSLQYNVITHYVMRRATEMFNMISGIIGSSMIGWGLRPALYFDFSINNAFGYNNSSNVFINVNAIILVAYHIVKKIQQIDSSIDVMEVIDAQLLKTITHECLHIFQVYPLLEDQIKYDFTRCYEMINSMTTINVIIGSLDGLESPKDENLFINSQKYIIKEFGIVPKYFKVNLNLVLALDQFSTMQKYYSDNYRMEAMKIFCEHYIFDPLSYIMNRLCVHVAKLSKSLYATSAFLPSLKAMITRGIGPDDKFQFFKAYITLLRAFIEEVSDAIDEYI